jgi:hypothetical protein
MPSNLARDFYDVAEINGRSGYCTYRQGAVLGFMESVRAPETQNFYVQKFKHASFGNAAQLGLLMQMTEWKQTVAVERVGRHVFNPHSSADVDSLTETVEAVLDAVSEFGPSVIKLKNLRAEQVQGEHLAALLRVTSTWQDEVADWKDALGVASKAVLLAGSDPEDILFGMI